MSARCAVVEVHVTKSILNDIFVRMIYRFDILTSTNDEAFNSRYGEGDIIVAEYQSRGRGQRGHKWSGGKGENLMFTAVFEPRFLAPAKQFAISEAVALAIVDALKEWGIEAKIKWTNDIYVGDKKMVGILIEHKLSEGRLNRSIVGIGLNVNQTVFDDNLPNPISMAQVLGRELSRENVLDSVIRSLHKRYMQLRDSGVEALREEYCRLLYRLGEKHRFVLPGGRRFNGTIRGVDLSGALFIEHESGEVVSYLFKEVEFVLKK